MATRKLSLRKCRVGVIGLGYVGLPLAVEFSKHFDTVGFDIQPARVAELERGRDSTLEVQCGAAVVPPAELHDHACGSQALRCLHRHGADAD